jgi:lipopolysaccharide/colanic/teichoic acid biosynthesis glycosyltransferase
MAQTKKPTPTPDERAAARQQSKEERAQKAAAESLKEVLNKIAKLDEPDKTNAKRIHDLVTKVAPSLTPKLLYGSPAYANSDGKPVLFYQERARFKGRYANLTFFGAAQLDEGTMWPTSWAITDLSPADEKLIARLVRQALGN